MLPSGEPFFHQSRSLVQWFRGTGQKLITSLSLPSLPPCLPSLLADSFPRHLLACLCCCIVDVAYSEDISANVGALEELQAAYHCDFLARFSFLPFLSEDR